MDVLQLVPKLDFNLLLLFFNSFFLKLLDTPNITSISFLNFPSLTDTTLYIPETGNLTIQINGTNFVSGTQCYLNGTAFPSQFISNSSIYCTFPPINGTNFYFLTVRLLPSGPDSSSFNVYYYRKFILKKILQLFFFKKFKFTL